MRGIILSGGLASRLHPTTQVLNKHLLPIYDKPMIYYPLSVLMLAGIREVMVISTPEHLPSLERLLRDGSDFGLSITYAAQARPDGLAQALLIGRDFIGDGPVTLILGDNFFFGTSIHTLLAPAIKQASGAAIFAYPMVDPRASAVVEIDAAGNVVSLEEKPVSPKSSLAVTGLYVFDNQAASLAELVRPSQRGELEITALHLLYLERGMLVAKQIGQEFTWLDAGTPDGLLAASQFVQLTQERHGVQIACLEEIALNHGLIGTEQVRARGRAMSASAYGRHLLHIAGPALADAR